MRKRWGAAGMPQAEQQFRRIVGYSDLAKLVSAIERRRLILESHIHAERSTGTESAVALAIV
jgi:hypothetical protein